MSTAVNDTEEYYCFRVKESTDSELDNRNIVIPCSYNFDLKKLRTELWRQFGVPRNRRISYIDDDGDDVPIDSECEFHEALKLAKNAFVANTAIPLIVGSFHVPTCSDDEQCSGTNEVCCPNKEPTSIDGNPISSLAEKSGGSMPEPNPEFDKQKFPTWKVSSNQKKLDARQCDEPSGEQAELEDAEVPRELNASLRCHVDTVPPSWFTEYMEAMKKDMVSTITQEVVKNVTEVLNKRLDSLTLKELAQSRGQSHPSLSKRHPRCSFDSNEKNQKRMRSQDEEQSSDASIERVDEPQNVSTADAPQTKKDVISTISHEVVKEMTEILNRIPLDSPHTSAPSKKLGQSRSPSHLPLSKRFPRHLDPSEKNQRKMRLQDGEQSMERTYEPRNASTADISRQLQKKLDLIGDAICASVLKEKKKKKKHHHWIPSAFIDNLNNDVVKKQSTQNNAKKELVFQEKKEKEPDATLDQWIDRVIGDLKKADFEMKRRNENGDVSYRKDLPLRTGPISYNETTGMFENEMLRMSCSVTGHQILDEGRRTGDDWCCDNPDTDKTTFCPCDQEVEDDDAFEIIQMPNLVSRNESFTRPEEPAAEQRRHDSNRDSPSFELLSESPSPTPTCCMHFNEEHFSANEGNAEQQPPPADANPSTSSIYVIDIHGKVHNECRATDLDQDVSTDLKKRSGGVYSFVTETLPVQDTHCSKSSHSEQRASERKNHPRDDVCSNAGCTYDDVRNSHTSYLTVRTHCDAKTQCSCQSQTDLSDFTQSFHSHTTSVTDTTDVYTESYGNCRYGEQVPVTAKDVREAATVTATMTATATTIPRSDHDSDCGEERTRSNERHYNAADNYSKCSFCSSHSSTPRGGPADPPYQSGRASGSSDRSSPNVGSRKTSAGDQTPLGTVDPVHILLPETLVTAVTAATHVGSYAYDTAREMLDKIRAHAREDSAKRRGGVKCDDKKRFFVGPLSLY
ncbi:PREDICTED: uncharacterized protein LOC105561261 [Vollenhovia emeryi]|uniref:uncharacterized protein LOC105561261 n=1 Tax=Vollenhovia emeryi TaxID=411798 RepID=UPI0005F3EE63|nr:PREDICTED: uncharacterized protein LOC105561261 [Vollenhovia emeryi]